MKYTPYERSDPDSILLSLSVKLHWTLPSNDRVARWRYPIAQVMEARGGCHAESE